MTGTVDPAVLAGLKGKAKFDFAACAAQARKDFSQETEWLLYFDADTESFLDTPGVDAFGLPKRFNEIQSFDKESNGDIPLVQVMLRNANETGSHVTELTDKVKAIVLDKDSLADNFWFPSPAPLPVIDRFVFEHELGHVVVEGAYEYSAIPGTEILRADIESKADVFALLRIINVFGDAARDFYDTWALGRVMDMINLSHSDHLTVFAIDKIMAEERAADVMKMSPGEIRDLAKRYGDENQPTDKELLTLMREFKPLKELLEKITQDNTEPLEKLAEIVTQPGTSPYAVYLGARFLKAFLQPGGIAFSGNGFKGQVALTGSYWDGMKEKISAAIDGIPLKHKLRGLPLHLLDATGKAARPPEPIRLLPFVRGDFKDASLPGAAYAVAAEELSKTPALDRELSPAARLEILAGMAAPGFMETAIDALIPQSFKSKAEGIVKNNPAYGSCMAMLSGESPLGISVHVISCETEKGGKGSLCLLSDRLHGLSLAVGDGDIPARLDKDLRGNGVTYVARKNPEAHNVITGFLKDMMKRRPESAVEEILHPIVYALSQGLKATPEMRRSGTTVFKMLTKTKPQPGFSTRIMHPRVLAP